MRVKLTDICEIKYGYAFDSAQFSETEGIPLVRIRDVVRGFSETRTTESFPSEYTVHDGDILIGMDGEFNVARWHGGTAALNQRVCRLIPKNVDNDYIFYFMPSALKAIEDKTSFVTVKHLSAKELNKITVPFPTPEIQMQIGKILNLILHIIDSRKQELQSLDNLIKARFVEMFGDRYNEDSLLNLCNIIDYRGKTPEKVESGLPFITAKNIRMHQMSMEPREYISKDTYDKAMIRGFPKEGDVVFTTEAPLGNVCRIPHFDTEFYIGQRIVTLQTEKLIPTYLEYAISTDEFKRKYMSQSSGSTVTGIRVRLLEQLTIPVPPLELQINFSKFVEQVDKSKFAVQKALEEAQLLFDSLMQKYFG